MYDDVESDGRETTSSDEFLSLVDEGGAADYHFEDRDDNPFRLQYRPEYGLGVVIEASYNPEALDRYETVIAPVHEIYGHDVKVTAEHQETGYPDDTPYEADYYRITVTPLNPRDDT